MTVAALRRATAALTLLAALLASACGGAAGGTVTVTWAQPQLRILALGDSITAAGQWQQEFARLAESYAGVQVAVDNEAVAGTRCTYWPDRIAALVASRQPDLVVLFCGTNDDPAETRYGESATGWAWRATVEAIHTARPADPVKILPGFIQYSDPLIAPQWLLDYEPRTNDAIYAQWRRYPGWFAGLANFQQIPSTATYLDDGGIHPSATGYRTMARIVYDSLRVGMGWSPVGPDELPLCDMYGHRRGYPRPAYTACTWTGG